MSKNYSGITSVGNEIISSNSQSQRNIILSGKHPKLIVKSYKFTNNSNIQDISNNSINNNNSQISHQKPKEIKRETTLNLSNIKYKDGYILKDAVNSNPGYGLWSIKTQSQSEGNNKKKENSIKKEESKNINMEKNTTKGLFHDKELNYKYTKFFDDDAKQNIRNKKIIEKLNNKLNDLEKKYMQTLSNYQEKKFICENTIKTKKEFEIMYQNNLKEIELIKQRTKEMDKDNIIVEQYLTNSKNEIERLLNVMKEDEKNMDKLKIEFERRIKKEKVEKIKLKEIIKEKEEQVSLLQEQSKNISTTNSFFEEEWIGNENKKNFEIKKLKEMILNLYMKISGLKTQIKNNKEEMIKLDKILKYKIFKDEYQKLNISNLFLAVEENERNEQRKNDILKNQNELIKNLNEQIRLKYNIITNKKMKKSLSQGMLINVNINK